MVRAVRTSRDALASAVNKLWPIIQRPLALARFKLDGGDVATFPGALLRQWPREVNWLR